jgi:hypothetical protein
VISLLDVGLNFGLLGLGLGLDLFLGRVWSLHVDLILGLELCLSLVVGLTVINNDIQNEFSLGE